MGAFGAYVAIETADIVLMANSPAKIVEAIEVGKKTYQDCLAEYYLGNVNQRFIYPTGNI